MANSYTICAEYYCISEGSVTFPEGKSWDDVDDWHIKWDRLYVKFKGEDDYHDFDLESSISLNIDWNRPASASIHNRNEDGTDYDEEIDSFE